MSSVNDPKASVDLKALRERLQKSRGQEYWRSLDELAQTEEFQAFLQQEFPRDAGFWMEPTTRRQFLKLMGASFGMAFLTACTKPLEKIIPYNQAPEDIIPGKPLYFASALPLSGYARGVLVENQMGRPTKIEGNPDHPDSLGSTDIFMQSAILTFYDPDRSQAVTRDGLIQTWDDFISRLRSEMTSQEAKKGAGLRILTETVTSPTLGAQLKELQRRFPASAWHQYEPVSRDNVREGARLAFGRAVETHYRFSEADIVLALDADFLSGMPGSLRYAREFTARRSAEGNGRGMNRLYVVEAAPSLTGAMADHRMALRPWEIRLLAQTLGAELGINPFPSGPGLSGAAQSWVRAVARDMARHKGHGLVLPGESQPPFVHAIAHAANEALGNFGATVVHTEPVEAKPVNQTRSLRQLADEMRSGKVDLLVILGGNPVFTAPADLDLGGAISRVKTRVRLGLHEDETSAACQWHIPEAHPLESWGDLRAFDGTATVQQPQIQPLYGGKTASEILSVLLDGTAKPGHDLVRNYWKAETSPLSFDVFWQRALHDGVIGKALAPRRLSLKPGWSKEALASQENGGKPSGELDIIFKPDPTIWDGSFANNGWLQELPKPLSKLTWDNAALVAPATAERLGLSNEDIVEISADGRSVEAPVWILPGQADGTLLLHFGHGRIRAGRVGTGTGFNAYPLRRSDGMWVREGASLRKTGRRAHLACTQDHWAMEGRELVREASLAEFRRNPGFAQDRSETPSTPPPLYNYSKPPQSEEYAWAMAVDLNLCTGCNVCTIACQAENNIPVVGKEQVSLGREMHWIRVDRYYQGSLDDPKTVHQPVPCMHCEEAPCEVVCPVGATLHSEEGLNQMVYNRCVGTRYCSNNCPYKVRRFNFFNYNKDITGSLKLMENPDVTVRSRGVMEKCTYCVQRINGAKIQAEKEGRRVKDGEITPACAQACPARAIVFGNLKDKDSRVSSVKSGPRDYAILSQLGVRPRTTYEARLRNPNPEIDKG